MTNGQDQFAPWDRSGVGCETGSYRPAPVRGAP
jgi:hypothetical protein